MEGPSFDAFALSDALNQLRADIDASGEDRGFRRR